MPILRLRRRALRPLIAPLACLSALPAEAAARQPGVADWPTSALVAVIVLALALAGSVLFSQQRLRARAQPPAARNAAGAEQTLVIRENLQRFESFANETIYGFGMAELDGTITYINPALARMLGESSPDAAIGRPIVDYHPAELRATITGEVFAELQRNGRWSGELPLLARDGTRIEVDESFFYIRDAQGEPKLIAAILTEIGARKRTEAELRLMASVFEHSGEAILVTDPDNRIITANAAFTELTGYTLDEVRGLNPRVLSAGLTSQSVYKEMWRAIVSEGYWQGEIWDRRKDGAIYPKWLSVSTVRNAAGELTHHVASFTDITERKQIEERIRHLAHHDPLTGLPNRLQLEGRLAQALAEARRDGGMVAVVFADLDNFKFINDSLGHPAGDRLLIEVARRLRECVRDSDVVARLGGDEFVIVLNRLDAAQTAATLTEKVRQRIGERYEIDGHILHTTPSLGVSIFPLDGADADTLMKNADAAMYHAKAEGRDNVQLFNPRLNEAASSRLRIQTRLREALEKRRLLLHYQPQLAADGRSLAGVEALIRWLDPDEGMIPPDRFIPIAEETGLIGPIGAWVIEESFRQLAQWRAAGLSGFRMSINLSAQQLRLRDLPRQIAEACTRHGLSAGDIELEITESTAMRDPESTIDTLRQLREMGIELAIDDFGTGYSSLSYLKLLPIGRLKLDRSFVHEIEADTNDAAICAATIALAHNLGLEVVAEGVETSAQFDFLRELDCDLFQGYLFSRPLDADALARFAARHRATGTDPAREDTTGLPLNEQTG